MASVASYSFFYNRKCGCDHPRKIYQDLGCTEACLRSMGEPDRKPPPHVPLPSQEDLDNGFERLKALTGFANGDCFFTQLPKSDLRVFDRPTKLKLQFFYLYHTMELSGVKLAPGHRVCTHSKKNADSAIMDFHFEQKEYLCVASIVAFLWRQLPTEVSQHIYAETKFDSQQSTHIELKSDDYRFDPLDQYNKKIEDVTVNFLKALHLRNDKEGYEAAVKSGWVFQEPPSFLPRAKVRDGHESDLFASDLEIAKTKWILEKYENENLASYIEVVKSEKKKKK